MVAREASHVAEYDVPHHGSRCCSPADVSSVSVTWPPLATRKLVGGSVWSLCCVFHTNDGVKAPVASFTRASLMSGSRRSAASRVLCSAASRTASSTLSGRRGVWACITAGAATPSPAANNSTSGVTACGDGRRPRSVPNSREKMRRCARSSKSV